METAIPITKFFSKEAKKVTSVKNIKSEDNLIAGLSGDPQWEALKSRIERKIKQAKSSVEITQGTMAEIKDFELYGFKCALSSLLVEELQGIINDVELTAKYLKDEKKKRK